MALQYSYRTPVNLALYGVLLNSHACNSRIYEDRNGTDGKHPVNSTRNRLPPSDNIERGAVLSLRESRTIRTYRLSASERLRI